MEKLASFNECDIFTSIRSRSGAVGGNAGTCCIGANIAIVKITKIIEQSMNEKAIEIIFHILTNTVEFDNRKRF